MTFHSILSAQPDTKLETIDPPVFFVDLNLDQVIDTITASKAEYDLKPYYYTPLNDIHTIQYRHEIMQDLENNQIYGFIKAFAKNMGLMRDHITQANKLHYKFQKESWFLDAVEIYCDTMNDLLADLSKADIHSQGLLAFRDFLLSYTQGDSFTSLIAETKQLKADLASVKYSIIIKDDTLKVRAYESETDYSEAVDKTFEKFKQGAVKDYKAALSNTVEMNHVEAKVLDFVALLYPEIFSKLDHYWAKNSSFIHETIGIFDREIQFYLAYLEYIEKFKRNGLKFCYPQISNPSKAIHDYEGYDLALAYKLIIESSPMICNDFYLEEKERIFIVSGPNQGGKTTFARTFGQLHYLASLGCPVPGREAQLYLFDQLFTHFEKQENINNLSGKLQDDLIRITDILDRATSDSIIILNEIFTSTTLSDAIFMSERVLEKISELDALCVCVTFIDELSLLNEKTVSMVSTVVPENPTLRTYKIIRKPADGLSYAISIAEKYQLTYRYLKERLKT